MKKLTEQEALQRRIHKVIGQCNGIERMVERGDTCEAILLQVSAALSALHRVGQMALERQLRESVREGLRKSDTEDVLCDELSHALDKFCAQA